MSAARDPGQRVEESVSYALRIVGPGEPSFEHEADEDATAERPAAV